MRERLNLLQAYVDRAWLQMRLNPSIETVAVLLEAADVVLASVAEDVEAPREWKDSTMVKWLHDFGAGLLKGELINIQELKDGRVRLTAEYPSMEAAEFVLEQLYVARAMARNDVELHERRASA